jgi:hypothetical protein
MSREFHLDSRPANEMIRSEYACDDRWIEAFLPGAREERVGTRWDYAIAIDSWSGKRNWPERAGQSLDWPALAEAWLVG